MQSKNCLYLIPTPIGHQKENRVLPEYSLQVLKSLKCFIVEKPQTTIRFLQWINHPVPTHEITFRVLNKKTPDHEVFSYLKLLKEQSLGLMSEAGAPGVADPGARLVSLAHENEISVIPLVGPSSILMALMASGMNGQKFAFHGYLNIRENQRKTEIHKLEQESHRNNQTQIFMETPHRNNMLFELLLETLGPSTKLCIACNITQHDELIQTKRIEQWRSTTKPDLQKRPALFLIYSA
ncbi:MAG: SAM-dependent methyltransferase [Balneolaceae bacterium]|nr:SAM-dependent methyltransferase [Balneolaceae bacterium]